MTQWHYAQSNQQFGPVPEAELVQKLQSGELSSSALVWREGMPEWQPAAVAVPSVMAGAVQCCECGQYLPASQLVTIDGLQVCSRCQPVMVQKLQEGVRPGSSAVISAWRDGKNVHTFNGATLPDRCVKCNQPTANKLKRKLQWHHPAIYALILVSLIVYVIVAVIVRRTAVCHVGLCEAHRSARVRDLWLGNVGWLGSLIGLIASFANDLPVIGVGLIALFLASLIYLVVRARVVYPIRIEKDGTVLLRGACRSYLESLPVLDRAAQRSGF